MARNASHVGSWYKANDSRYSQLKGTHITFASDLYQRSQQSNGDKKIHLSTEVGMHRSRRTREPDRVVLHDISEEDKELALCFQSEKLAIAYGLIHIPKEQPTRVYKNLRVCLDCHTATKLISKVTGREIVARDANRFHHVKMACVLVVITGEHIEISCWLESDSNQDSVAAQIKSGFRCFLDEVHTFQNH